MYFTDCKVMIDLAGQYVLTATIVDRNGRSGFWFSDYPCDTVESAWECADHP
jgi:hypothetical protein